MSLRIPVSASAAEEIKLLAKRFSKELQSLTGERIRGTILYDAFVKPLGYESFSEVKALSGRSKSTFPMREYIAQTRGELRKHLPRLIGSDVLEVAFDKAVNPGCVSLTIDAREAPDNSIHTLTNSLFYRDFREEIFAEGRRRHIQYSELFDAPKRYKGESRNGSIVFVLDYSLWPNETDPLFDWERFDSFIRMVHTNATTDNGVEMEVRRVTQKGDIEFFKGFNQYRIPEWEPNLSMLIDEHPMPWVEPSSELENTLALGRSSALNERITSSKDSTKAIQQLMLEGKKFGSQKPIIFDEAHRVTSTPRSMYLIIRALKDYPYGDRFPVKAGDTKAIRYGYSMPIKPVPRTVKQVCAGEPIDWGGNTVHSDGYEIIYDGPAKDAPKNLF